jgi:putative Mg2+ transporter-C (MgtC) family protein
MSGWFSNDIVILGEILLSVVLSGIIGYERELAHKPAGLRTHMLVAASATLILGLGDVVVSNFQGTAQVTSDPIRLMEAVIVGVSFLGAGTILQREKDLHVEGLTTAASLLFTAVIGISVAVNQILLALGAVLLTLIITRGVAWVQGRSVPR